MICVVGFDIYIMKFYYRIFAIYKQLIYIFALILIKSVYQHDMSSHTFLLLTAFFGEFGKHNRFIMKKVLILICAFCMSVTEPTIALTKEILIAENMQQENWEELGKVSFKFYKEGGNYMGMFSEGILYVRVIGERTFYRVKIETMYDVKFYSVAVGEYIVEGKKYNAKIAENYYFNI